MAYDEVKLTVRLPSPLHAALRQAAEDAHRSLNGVVVESLWRGLALPDDPAVSEHEAVARVLREQGLWQPSPPRPGAEAGDAEPDHAALRREFDGVPPLSEVIIADRGPR